MINQHVESSCTFLLLNKLHAAGQGAKLLLSVGSRHSKPMSFVKRKMHKAQFDIELTLSRRFQLAQ